MIDYDQLNDSELIKLCHKQGYLTASRGIDRRILIRALKGEEDLDEYPEDPINAEREAMLTMQETWPIIFHQLKCGDQHYACWNCPSARVVHCVVLNCDPVILKRSKENAG